MSNCWMREGSAKDQKYQFTAAKIEAGGRKSE